jgi:hypothetical protein
MPLEHCPEHEKLMETIHRIDKTVLEVSVRINGSIGDIEKHIESGQTWRIAISCIAGGWVISLITIAFFFGGIVNQVDINTSRWDRLLEKHPVVLEIAAKDK